MDNTELLTTWFEHLKFKARQSGDEFNQVTLAEKSGVAQQYISKILTRKRNLGDKVLTKLCAGMGITKAEFFSGPPKSVGKQAAGMMREEVRVIRPGTTAKELRGSLVNMIIELPEEALREVYIFASGIYDNNRERKSGEKINGAG